MSFKRIRNTLIISSVALSLLFTAACGEKTGENDTDNTSPKTTTVTDKKLSGNITIDGSSTVGPISEVAAELFNEKQKDVKITIGETGTGNGMKRFYAGQIDICDASRTMSDSEKAECQKNGVEYTEFKVAYDGITVVVNKQNNWLDSITVVDLKKIWEPNSTVKKWSDINPSYPQEDIKLYGPGMESGTMEYFTEQITGKKKSIRTDYTASEDDNTLVNGVAGDKYGIAFFGFSYFEGNMDKLKALSIDAGSGAVKPSFDTIKSLTYKPLSRPLYIYVKNSSLQQEHIKEFVKFYLTEAKKIAEEAQAVPMDDYKAELDKLK